MKQLIFVLLISCLACANNQAGQAERKKDMESTKEIYLAEAVSGEPSIS